MSPRAANVSRTAPDPDEAPVTTTTLRASLRLKSSGPGRGAGLRSGAVSSACMAPGNQREHQTDEDHSNVQDIVRPVETEEVQRRLFVRVQETKHQQPHVTDNEQPAVGPRSTNGASEEDASHAGDEVTDVVQAR